MGLCHVGNGSIVGYVVANESGAQVVKDSSGNLWMVYTSGTSLYCKKSTTSGVTWGDAETVVAESYGITFDLGIDSANHLQVVYAVRTGTSVQFTLYHIIRDPVTLWTTKAAIYGATVAYWLHPHLAIDSSDNIHVVYHKGTLGSAAVKYVKCTSGTWGSEVSLASKYSMGIYSSYDAQDICVDSLGYLHVVYEGGTDSIYLYYMLNNGSWQAEETIAGFGGTTNKQIYPSVLVDSTNVVHVIWSGMNYGVANPTITQICYISGNTGAWSAVSPITDTTDSFGYAYGISISIDSAGDIHSLFYGSAGVRYLRKNGSWGNISPLPGTGIANVYGMLWSKYPSTNIVSSGFIGMTDGSAGGTSQTFPSSAMSRAGSIRHIYRPGVMQMAVTIGAVTTDVPSTRIGEVVSAIPTTPKAPTTEPAPAPTPTPSPVPYDCPFCGAAFSTATELAAHIDSAHSSGSSPLATQTKRTVPAPLKIDRFTLKDLFRRSK